MAETVDAADYRGLSMSIAQLWGSGPKWTITCGECYLTFRVRIPIVDTPGIKCTGCGIINILRGITTGRLKVVGG